jgi:LacI family repressor for deo operon, udp, cdd, tsx, nupC, and nupG
MTTIEDVAKLAGLSRSTVSRVMNNHPYVTQEKKELVQKAMEELEYVPNSIAQRLRKQTMQTIAVLIPRISNPFFSKLVEVMEINAAENGLQLVVCQTRYDMKRELGYLNMLRTKQFDGVIMAAVENDWDDIKDYTTFGPIIFCNDYDERAEVPTIRLNQFKGGYIATRHLVERGHKKIAYCRGTIPTNLTVDRQRGFLQVLKESGLTANNKWTFTNALTIEDGKRILREIIAMDDPPTAVFTGSDEVAAGIVKEAKNHGVKIPDDLAVVGFDDQPVAELITPGLTTVYQPVEEIGKKTMAVMTELITHQKKLEEQLIELPLHLIVREST